MQQNTRNEAPPPHSLHHTLRKQVLSQVENVATESDFKTLTQW